MQYKLLFINFSIVWCQFLSFVLYEEGLVCTPSLAELLFIDLGDLAGVRLLS